MTRRKRASPRSASSLDPSQSMIGPASTPQIAHHPPLFQPEHLFPLLRNRTSRPSPSYSSKVLNGGSDSPLAARETRQATHKALTSPSVDSLVDYSVLVQPRSDHAISADTSSESPDDYELNVGMYKWGLGLVVASTVCFVFGFWSIAVGPFIGPQGIWLLDRMAQDTHYKYLFILLVPVTLYAVIINWWGLKIFRHA